MAGEEERSWLPEPPPPRPARRDQAIETALRKFDGEKSAPASAPERARSRGWVHRPQAAMLVTATLLVVVGVPAAFIGLRNSPQTGERASPPPAIHHQPVAPDAPTAALPPAVRAPAPALPSAPQAAPAEIAQAPAARSP